MDRTENLSDMVQAMIDQNETQAAVAFHEYLAAKMQEKQSQANTTTPDKE